MPRLADASPLARIQIAVLAAAALGALLLRGSWLVLGVGIGTHICEHYTSVIGGSNERLRAWCTGHSSRSWLGWCLLAALAVFTAGTAVALSTARPDWLAPATVLAVTAIWAGFALPQQLAGPDTTTQPTPPPPSSTTTPPAPPRPQPPSTAVA
jgi:hypothetical protein